MTYAEAFVPTDRLAEILMATEPDGMGDDAALVCADVASRAPALFEKHRLGGLPKNEAAYRLMVLLLAERGKALRCNLKGVA